MDPLSAVRFATDAQLQAAGFAQAPNLLRGSDALAASGLAGVSPLGAPAAPLPIAPGAATGRDTFAAHLGALVEGVDAKQAAAADAARGLLTGGNVSLHQAVIAMEEASVSFQLMVEVRNKLLESYQELMRMQI